MIKKDDLNIFGEIKKDFFRYRNGIIADSLKNMYPSGKQIFGLTAPQLKEISKKYPKDQVLGMMLWNDRKVRESRMLALYLLSPTDISFLSAKEMIEDVQSKEEAEFLAFKILRNLPYAEDLLIFESKIAHKDPNIVYCVEMLRRNLEILRSNQT